MNPANSSGFNRSWDYLIISYYEPGVTLELFRKHSYSLLSPPKKSGGDIGMVSIGATVHLGFLTIIWKSNGSINLKFGDCICWESVQNWSAFGQYWLNFDSFMAKKTLKLGQSWGFRPLSEKLFTQSNSNLVCTLIGWLFRIDSLFSHIGQIWTL